MGVAASPRTLSIVTGPMPSHASVAPGLSRSGTSVRGSSRTSPRIPCGPRTRATTSDSSPLIDLEVDLGPIARRHHLQQRADGLRDTAAPADDLPHVVLGHLQVQLDELAVELLGDDDGGRIVDEL